MAELTERMEQALCALARLDSEDRFGSSAASIAMEVQRVEGDFELIEGGGSGAGRGSGHRVFNQAQRFITPLRALEERGLAAYCSGGKYALTDEGDRLAATLSRDQ